MNILVFPCGSEIGLEVFESLKFTKDINLIGGSSVSDHGKFTFKKYYGNFPFVNDKKFIPFVKKFVKDKKINFIYPCMDSVLYMLKKHEKEINCKILTSDLQTTEICLSKEKTYEKLKNIIPIPKCYKNIECVKNYPVYLKPKIGYGTRNHFLAKTKEEAEVFLKNNKNYLILEYLNGKEYTIDCFTDKKNNLIFINGRERARITNGISTNIKITNNKNFKLIAKKINKTLKFNGAWFFQLKEDSKGKLKLLEIAPRIAGSSGICKYLGVNLPELNILNEIYNKITIQKQNLKIETDRALKTKSIVKLNFKYVYIDLDDTIIINEKTINTNMIKLIFQFINENKKIILISKHKKNIIKTLEKYRIKNIFDKIIHLKSSDKKSNYIEHKNSIFIDDSFQERIEVFKKNKIHTFSVSSSECFLNS